MDTNRKKRVNILVGRFQPITKGHLKCIKYVWEKYNTPTVILMIDTKVPNERHPFNSNVLVPMYKELFKSSPMIADILLVKNADIVTNHELLMSKGYVQVLNPDLVTYISDWLEHNKIRADRKIDSIYKDLLLQILPNVQLIEKKDRADRKKKKVSEITQKDGDTYGTSQGQAEDINGTAQDSVVEDRRDKDRTGECRYQLGKEILTDTQYNNLLQSYPQKLLDEVINRIISHPYIGCLNVNTISQWCMEAKKRQGVTKTNAFTNFSQREYDFEELERVLLAN